MTTIATVSPKTSIKTDSKLGQCKDCFLDLPEQDLFEIWLIVPNSQDYVKVEESLCLDDAVEWQLAWLDREKYPDHAHIMPLLVRKSITLPSSLSERVASVDDPETPELVEGLACGQA